MPLLNPRRRSVVAGLTLALGSSLALLPAPAHAAPVDFTVIGTSDVSDSNLMSQVIEPRFEALYPQYDLKYVAQGTGAAITSARAGNGAAIIVHAATTETGFVGDGYSLEPTGRLIFWGDYVLLGPTSDPAGIAAADPHDIVGAFEKLATAGTAGTASFVSRGGTPGTVVQEHALWARTTGVPLCSVPTTGSNGGGKRPTVPASDTLGCGATADDQGTAPWPAWYNTGDAASQAGNVNIANTCPPATFPHGNCYVFTDRGTYNSLKAQGLAQNLKIVTRDNDPAARGGREALINVFHAYGVNPAKFPDPSVTKTDPVAAKLFLDFLTSPTTQQAMGDYLRNGTDQSFVPAAAPNLTATWGSESAQAGKGTKITGTVSNNVPGYPALNGVTVNLLEAASNSPLAIPQIVATTVSDGAGNYAFNAKLTPGKNYRVGVGSITKLELPNLTPPFSDILAPTTTQVGTVGGVTVKKVKKLKNGRFTLTGKAVPSAVGKGKIIVTAAKKKGGKFTKIGKIKLKDGKSKFSYTDRLKSGKWFLVLTYENGTEFLPGVSKKVRVTIS